MSSTNFCRDIRLPLLISPLDYCYGPLSKTPNDEKTADMLVDYNLLGDHL